ncbi:hypothetical protein CHINAEXTREME_20525 (plasmid) [Halobiforma lacisalsi AJ5]|uniref:Uncharacterized protein n=1 Tax=Natronobacterium lacisalsi AJ5 TaxID=358396 RepID=M0LYF6_NATLA|nr:hypothetical protein [Halobiforma lacisalsi]APX00200.1 hypothetical protein CHINAEXTREME_20525 [Halobiforma lacisalsi AJ5]EMA37384.1 hypothetical protein C445_00806 [Halobiforma lacisalsi AJ5]
MIRRKDDRKRDRNGRFAKYDSEKQRDRGKQAHENWFQTQFRRLWWAVKKLIPGRGRNRSGPRK